MEQPLGMSSKEIMNCLTTGLLRKYPGCSLVSGDNEIIIYSANGDVFVQI